MQVIQQVSMIGICVGAMALVVVLSAFNGLEDLVRSFYDRFDPDIKIEAVKGKHFEVSEQHFEALCLLEGVDTVAKVLEEKVFLRYGDRESVAMIKGVDAAFPSVTGVKESIRIGAYEFGEEGLLLGMGLAYKLGIYLNEARSSIQVFVPKEGIPRPGQWQDAYRTRRLGPKAVFSIQPDFDDVYALTSLEFCRELLQLPASVSALEVKVAQGASMDAVKARVMELMGPDFRVRDRDEQQATVFKVLQSEGLMTYLILSLTLAIACFTILGAITISLVEKRRDLFTLWSIGMPRSSIRRLFFRRGMQITLIGGVSGMILGVAVVALQHRFGLLKLGSGYAVDAYPVRISAEDMLLVTCTLLVLGGLSSLLAVSRLKIGVVRTS